MARSPLHSASSQATVQLYQGWNLCSLPLLPEDNRPEIVLQDVIGALLYYYDAFEPDALHRWKIYDSGAPPVTWTLRAMRPYEAYWLWSAADHALSVEGALVSSNVLNLKVGWNMVSFQQHEVLARSIMDQISSSGWIYHYDASIPNLLERWTMFGNPDPPWTRTLETVRRGEGYWLWSGQDQTIQLPGAWIFQDGFESGDMSAWSSHVP